VPARRSPRDRTPLGAVAPARKSCRVTISCSHAVIAARYSSGVGIIGNCTAPDTYDVTRNRAVVAASFTSNSRRADDDTIHGTPGSAASVARRCWYDGRPRLTGG
jgi:hypothetical protein